MPITSNYRICSSYRPADSGAHPMFPRSTHIVITTRIARTGLSVWKPGGEVSAAQRRGPLLPCPR